MKIDPFPHNGQFLLAANTRPLDTSRTITGTLNRKPATGLTFDGCWSEARGDWVATSAMGTPFASENDALQFLKANRQRLESTPLT